MAYRTGAAPMAAIAAVLMLAACGGGDNGGGAGGNGQQAAPPPPPVGVVAVQPQSVTLTTELPGRLNAYETSQVRPQVNGLVLDRLFVEGDQVRQGQALYRIDSQPYQAAVANARAGVARARAAIASSQALARRYGELVRINAISRQEFDNATTQAQQAQADVAAQQAALRTAQIDLARTTIRAPISGRIGRSAFTTGALVTAGQTDPLTTIQRLDPIYIDITQSASDLLRIRQQILQGELSRGGGASATVRLRLEDGSVYPQQGKLQFADVTVDPSTGAQVIRAVFPNPQRLLLPGMYARAELVEGTKQDALLVPQRAVTRDERGKPSVLVVGADRKLAPRSIEASRTIGTNWLVTGGLKAGERVVVEGAQMLRPGMAVSPYPFREGQTPPQPGGQPAGAAGAQQKK